MDQVQHESIIFCIVTVSCIFHAAQPDDDYIPTSESMEFPVGSATGEMKCLNVSIIDDDVLEDTEAFLVVMNTSDPNVMIATNITVLISDNDGIIINIILS